MEASSNPAPLPAGARPRAASTLRNLLIMATLLAGASPAAAQNLLPNGDFSSGLDGWTQLASGEAEASPIDIDGNPASGSALIRSVEPLAGTRVYPLRQCVLLTEPGRYRFGTSGRIPASGGRLVASIAFYSGTTCTGGLQLGAGVFLDRVALWEKWEYEFPAEQLPRAFLVQLGIEKDAVGGSYSGLIDDVHLLLLDRFFANGFD